jgi:hypothetical protein
VGCFPFKEEPLQTVQPGLGGSPSAVKTPIKQQQLPPASREEALRIDIVGQKLLTNNRQTGLHCVFSAIGASSSGAATPELFHRSTDAIFITESLSRKCQTEGQLAALLAYEMGRIIVEREALAGPAVRRAQRDVPLESHVGGDSGGTFGSADGVHLAELAKLEKERPQRGAVTPHVPDPMVLARGYLEKAGYLTRDLDEVTPLLKEARANDTIERQLNGGR